MKKTVQTSIGEFEHALADMKRHDYVLRLYVAGSSPRSTHAIANVRKICEQYLPGSYRLEVIDLYQQPQLAQTEQIVAAPTLIKRLPLPVRRVLGDMSRTDRILVVLGIAPRREVEPGGEGEWS